MFICRVMSRKRENSEELDKRPFDVEEGINPECCTILALSFPMFEHRTVTDARFNDQYKAV